MLWTAQAIAAREKRDRRAKPERERMSVELHLAFLWTCDECGRDNFARAVTVAPESVDLENLPVGSHEEGERIREFLEAGNEGGFLQAPTRVRCAHCHAEFKAIPAD